MSEKPAPSFSVVVPVHNKASHLARSFGSIFSQTYSPREIIAVDDVSTDNSRAILRDIADPRFRLIERDPPNAGPGGARNIGIRAATSEWVAFLDADDEWKPDFLATLAEQAKSADDNVSCLFTGFENDYGDHRRVHEYVAIAGSQEVRRLNLISYLEAWLTTKRSPMHTSSVAVRRRVLQAVGMFPEGPDARRGEDIALWLKCLTQGDALSNPHIGATYYREAENMATKTTSANVRPIICSIIREILPSRSPREQKLLKQLNNHIIYDYARIATRSGSFDALLLRDLYLKEDIAKTLALIGMTVIPPSVQARLRGRQPQKPTV